MSDSRVFSGYTETMEAERTKWYENLNNEQLEWEDLAAQKSTNNLLRKLKTVPIYRYLLNYFLYTWESFLYNLNQGVDQRKYLK